MAEQLIIDISPEISTITLNNPSKRNALSYAMMREITEAFVEVGKTNTLAIILAAAGPVFSAGHNLGEMVGLTFPQARKVFDACVEMIDTMQSIPQPVIGKIHATAAAGGCQLAASCDLVVAAESATFSMPGIKRGLFCHTPLVAVSRAIGQKKALEMALTGDSITAAEAEQFGLINYCVSDGDLDEAVLRLAHRVIDDGSPYARALGKKTFYAQIGLSQPSAYDLAREVVSLNATLPDAQEGFASFIEKRPAQFKMPPNG